MALWRLDFNYVRCYLLYNLIPIHSLPFFEQPDKFLQKPNSYLQVLKG